jgi:hypothetical protein
MSNHERSLEEFANRLHGTFSKKIMTAIKKKIMTGSFGNLGFRSVQDEEVSHSSS